jgi:class 3 adenylate cyclase/tetratricopeptide (TPR) repeat protein
VWADGRVIGGWAQTADGSVGVKLLERVDLAHQTLLRHERARLETWFRHVRSCRGSARRSRRNCATRPRARRLRRVLTCSNCGRESPEDFAFCPACAAPLARVEQPHEVRKTVTVVFCDVTGSTAMGERLDPESLRRVMSRYFDEMRAALERHGGTVEKFIGDAVMAVFGVPSIHEDDALRAVRAAGEMREALTTLNKELERDHGVSLTARIGVNTGEVVAGDLDHSLVTGDAVNVAARLEQAAEPGTVLLGAETLRLVRDAVVAEPVEPLRAKGKSEPLDAFLLVEVMSGAAGVARRLDSPMVGRQRQLAQLRQAFDASVADRSCQLFTVLGAPGVGKSRLVEELLALIHAEATVLRGRCLPYGDGITFFPVGEVVKEAAGLEDFDAPEEIERKICAVLGDAEQGAACSTLAQLFGAADRDSVAEETFWAVRRFLESVAQTQPLAVVFDDIHWGEATFLDLIEHIADWSRDAPILVLCMARPDLLDVRSAWGGGKFNAATISLERLSDEDCDDLIANLLGRAALPDEARGRILEAAEGTPLFVEEMLAMLIDDGLLVLEDDRWIATGDVARVAVPPTIQALLAARLDRLSGDERAVIERAAVAGKQFHVGAVRALLDEGSAVDVRGTLMSLVRRDLIGPDRSLLAGDDAFRFRHLLIRDAAYEAAPKALRARLHERFADWLVEVGGDRVEEQEEIVAYHLEQAYRLHEELGPVNDAAREIGPRAAMHYAACGRRASDRSDENAAAALFRHAADLLPEGHVDRPRMLYEVGHAFGGAFEAPLAFAASNEAVKAAAAAGQTSLEWMARIERSAAHMLMDPHGKPTDEVREELAEALEVFEGLGDERGLATAWSALADIEWMPCRFDTAREEAERAAEHARKAGERRLIARALIARTAAEFFGSTRPEEALASVEAMSAEISREGLFGHLALMQESFFTAMRGDMDRARRLSDDGIAIGEQLGVGYYVAASAGFRGEIEILAGDPVAAERATRRAYEILQRLGDEGHRSTSAANLAVALCLLGRLDEAEMLADVALELAAEDDLASQVIGRIARARVRSARGLHDEAVALAREAVDLFAEAEAPNQSGDLWIGLAESLRAAGRMDEASEAARTALGFYERKGNRPAIASVRSFLDAATA